MHCAGELSVRQLLRNLIRALEVLLARHGFVKPEEISSRHAREPGAVPKAVLKADMVAAVLAKGGPCDRPVDTAPSFVVGQKVRTLNINPVGHTRLPRYARAKIGVVEACRGLSFIQTTTPMGVAKIRNGFYTVVFDGEEIWAGGATPTLTVSIDAWESYLEPV